MLDIHMPSLDSSDAAKNKFGTVIKGLFSKHD